MDIQFKGIIRQVSNSYVITVPKSYILNRLLLPAEEYIFFVKEAEKKSGDTIGED